MDNLIAQGKAKPMIVVMPNGHPAARRVSRADTTCRDGRGQRQAVASMEDVGDIIAFVRATTG